MAVQSLKRKAKFPKGPSCHSSYCVFDDDACGHALSSSLIWACSKNKDLARGTNMHHRLLKRGLDERTYSDALVTMYANCGHLWQARALLDMHKSRNIVPWNALIAGYARQRQGHNALEYFERMRHDGLSPNAMTYASVLKACAMTRTIEKGKQIHDEILGQGLLKHNVVLGGALVDMYAKCGALPQAQSVLEKIPSHNVILWSALIAGYAQAGQGQQALACFKRMQHEGIPPNAVTYMSILKACATMRAINKGKEIHDEISRQGLLGHNIMLGGALVDMYTKCGALSQARSVLEELPSRDVVLWNTLIAGYAENGQGKHALECLKLMERDCILPDPVTYLCILKACAMIGAIDKGKQIHDEISRQGMLEHNIALGGALVDMYAKCGALVQAQRILEKLPSRDAVLWNALITGYAQRGQGKQALECYSYMQREGVLSTPVTYVCILKACAVIGAIDMGKQIHDEISRQGLLEHNIMLGNAVIDLYARCGAFSQAQSVLEKLPYRNVISWSALIAGYSQGGQGELALKSFDQMCCEGILPDVVTFRCLLTLCKRLGLVEKGQELFHSMGAKYSLKPDVECFSCMVDLLGRAGHLAKAVQLIQHMSCAVNSAAIWHCLLSACQKWIDVKVGTWAFQQAVKLDKYDKSAYISMVYIYAAAGMPENAKVVEAMRPTSQT